MSCILAFSLSFEKGRGASSMCSLTRSTVEGGSTPSAVRSRKNSRSNFWLSSSAGTPASFDWRTRPTSGYMGVTRKTTARDRGRYSLDDLVVDVGYVEHMPGMHSKVLPQCPQYDVHRHIRSAPTHVRTSHQQVAMDGLTKQPSIVPSMPQVGDVVDCRPASIPGARGQRRVAQELLFVWEGEAAIPGKRVCSGGGDEGHLA